MMSPPHQIFTRIDLDELKPAPSYKRFKLGATTTYKVIKGTPTKNTTIKSVKDRPKKVNTTFPLHFVADEGIKSFKSLVKGFGLYYCKFESL